MTLDSLKAFLLMIWNFTGVQVIVFSVLLNLALALAVAIKTSKVNLQELGDFLFHDLVPMVIVYAAFSLLGDAVQMPAVADVVLGLIIVKIGAKIVANLQLLGISLPENVQKLVAKPQ